MRDRHRRLFRVDVDRRDIQGEVIVHFRHRADGEFLWQYSSKELETYVWRWSHPGLGSSPLVEGNRLWFVSNRGVVVCLDTEGFHDDEDDGPVKGQWSRLFDVTRPRVLPSFGPDKIKDRLHTGAAFAHS